MPISAKASGSELEAAPRGFVGAEIGPDRVDAAMIRHWCEAMGDRNPVYTDRALARESVHAGIAAPPPMLQAWILQGMQMAEPRDATGDRQLELHQLLTRAGYPSVVATNCRQGYTRYLRPGDQVVATT